MFFMFEIETLYIYLFKLYNLGTKDVMNFNSANISLGQLCTHIQPIAFSDFPHNLGTKYLPVISPSFYSLQVTFKKIRIFLRQVKKDGKEETIS